MAWYPEANEVFLKALEALSPEECGAYLDQRCRGNVELRGQVQSLLDASERAGSFLEPSTIGPEAVADQAIHEGPGTIIGPYKLLQQIGEGGFGVVFMAEQQQPLRRKVALKVIKPGMDTRQVIARFEAERQALALMDHPHVARVLDAGATASGRPYFVMELVNGLPITDYCDQNRLNPRERLALFIHVCQAVQHAHQKGIIHRDIKPSNVMITLHEGTPLVKVIDFGIAKATGQQLTDKTLFTSFGQMIGTPMYMSPEQAEMSGLDVDTRSDIYSLGVLLYELLTGATPFDKDRLRQAGYDEIRRIIREEEPPRPSTRMNGSANLPNIAAQRKTDPKLLSRLFRGDVDWIVMKALEKDRARRYETASSMARDIQRYLHDEPVEACPPSALYRFRKFVHRNKRMVATSVAGLVAAAAVAASFGIYYAYTADRLGRALAEADHLTAGLALDRGLSLCEQGDTGPGLLWLARSLEFAVKANDPPLERVIRINVSAWSARIHPLRGCLRHAGRVKTVTFSPDSTRVATGCTDGTAQLWQAATGEAVGPPLVHREIVAAIAFSPDGLQLVTGCADGTAYRWDARTGMAMQPALAHGAPIHLILCSANGRSCLIVGGRSVSVWDINTGKRSATLDHETPVSAAALSADGETVLTGTGAGLAMLWELPAGTPRGMPLRHAQAVRAVALHPGGKTAATGDEGGRVMLWDTKTGASVREAPRHGAAVATVVFSPDGRQLLSAGRDWRARLSYVDEQPPVAPHVLPHLGPVQTASFSSDGKTVLTGSMDGRGRLWDAASGEPICNPLLYQAEVHVALFSPDSRSVALVGNDDTVRLWGAVPPAALFEIVDYPEHIYAAAFSPDGSILATAGEGDAQCPIRLWDAASGQPRRVLAGHPRTLRALAFSSDGKRLVSGGGDGARIWDVATGRELHRTDAVPGWVSAVALSPDGGLLFTGTHLGAVQLWDVPAQMPRAQLPAHGGLVLSAAFSPDGARWLTSSTDLTAHLGATASGQLLGPPLRHQGQVWSVAFSPDGRLALTGSDDRTVRGWDAATGQALGPPLVDPFMARLVAFSPDGQVIVKGGLLAGSRLWDTATRKPLGPPMPHPGAVLAAHFTGDGRHVLLTGEKLRAAPVAVQLVPATGDPERVALQCRLLTGLELGPDEGLRVLDAEAWHNRHRRLAALGPAPAP